MKRLKICIIIGLLITLLMANAVGAAFVLNTSDGTTILNFNGTKNSKWLNVSGVPEGTAWGNLTNLGPGSATFKISIDNVLAGIQIYVNNVDSMTGKKTITSVPGVWPGSTNLPQSSSVKLYMRANFTNLANGAYTNNLNVN